MPKSFLAFDLGASSGRAIIGRLADGRLSLREVHRFENRPLERDGNLFWDYPGLVNELKNGLRAAFATDPGIAGIAVDTWGVDYVLFRQRRELVRFPYHYRDERTARHGGKVHARIPRPELYARTGIQHMWLNTVFQLAAHHIEHPEDFADAELLLMPDALEFALGGDFTGEYTHASTTGLLNLKTGDWDFELIDRLKLPRSIFPPLVKPCTRGGVLNAALCRELGCGPVPILKVGSHDTASAVAAVPALPSTDWAYLSCGTWALLGAEVPAGIATPESEAIPFTNEGGLDGTIRLLSNIMGSWLLQETRRTWREAGREITFGEMSAMAERAEPCRFLIDPDDDSFVAPGDMPARVRAFCRATGQGEIPTDDALLRCIYDSLALAFADRLQALGRLLHKEYRSLNIVGGGTRDPLLMQLAADAADLPVEAGPVEATAIGNMLAQAIALGDVADLAAAREIVRNTFDPVIYLPDPVSHAACSDAMATYRQLRRKD